jgi:hypothetical protein
MAWTARIYQGGRHQLLQRCTSCAKPMFDYALLPTGDRICIHCVAEELAKAEEEIDVDRERRLGDVKHG